MKGQGVHTAFVDLVELLKEKDDIRVVVNNEGVGDVFHCHTYGPYYFWKGRGYRGRRVHTAHVIPDSIKGSLPMWKQLMPLVRWYFKLVFSYADVVIAISPMVELAIRDLGVKTKITQISNPIPIQRWKRTEDKRAKGREMLALSGQDKIVLGVGQLQGRKGVEDFLDVAESMQEAKFVWVGGRPFGRLTEGIARIDRRIAASGPHVHFTGLLSLEDMPLIYAAADILLFPSYQENCPLAPLEAAACGLPVVFRDIEEYRSLYLNPYLKAGNTGEFTSITKQLITDRDYYAKAAAISEGLTSQFNSALIRDKLLRVYAELGS